MLYLHGNDEQYLGQSMCPYLYIYTYSNIGVMDRYYFLYMRMIFQMVKNIELMILKKKFERYLSKTVTKRFYICIILLSAYSFDGSYI